ncbi:MAG TPA: TonB-dependent receptor [Spongiibacteraceae bacterium]|nr:TonB-dependent receptor [Spongiibacteraceae bacterium]
MGQWHRLSFPTRRQNPVYYDRSSASWLPVAALPLVLLFSSLSSAEQSIAAKSTFNIQAQDLEAALIAFTEQAHLQLAVSTDDVRTLKTSGVVGQFTAQEALEQLLAASGLSYKMTGPTTVVIRPAAQLAQAEPAAAPARTAPTQVSGISEVIVTAQKHEENIQTVPLAISALTADEMTSKGITSFDGVARATPSVSFTAYPVSSNTLILYMRGVGVEDPGPITSEGSVGLYEDGFVISRPNAATFDLADLERVEVVRGPQGTLYGRNTTGGAVNLISKQPTGEFGFKQSFSFGTRDLFRSLTVVDLPKWGDVSTKVTLLKSSIDGYVKNAGSSHDYGEQAQKAGRFALHWDAAPSFTVDYFMEKGNLDSTPVYFENPSLAGSVFNGVVYPAADSPPSRTYRPIDLKLSTSDFEGHGLTMAWDITETLTIKSLTGYRKLNADTYQDFAESFGVNYTTDGIIHQHQFSQELQFVGNLLDSRINYLAGLYYFKESGSGLSTITYPDYFILNNQNVTAESKSKAAFGQLSWTPDILDQRLELTVGARYTKDDRLAERTLITNDVVLETGAKNSLSSSQFNPSFTANFQWTPDLSTYGKVATGYRAGGSYGGSPIGEFGHTASPEKLTSYEMGLKSYWFEHRVRLNMAAFESKYRDMQLLLAADPNDQSINQLYNAGSSTIRGLEMEALFAPSEDFSLSIDYAYLKATFDKVDVIPGTLLDRQTNPASPYQVGDNIKDLFALPFAPKHSVSIGSDYTFLHFDGGKLSAHLDYRWQDKIFLGSGAGTAVPGRDLNSQAAYGLVNGRLILALDLPRGDHATVSLWGKNIAHKRYVQYAVPLGGGVVPVQVTDPASGAISVNPAGYTSQANSWAEPASFGFDLVYQY